MQPSVLSAAGVMLAWVAFAAALFVAHRRAGSAPVRLRGRSGLAGIVLQAAGFAFAWGALPIGREILVSTGPLGRWLIACAAVALAFAGAGFAIWAIRALGKQWSIVPQVRDHHDLITTGPYAVVRHPIYTAMAGLLAATALAFTHPLGLALGLIAYALGTLLRVRAEERLLRAAFGEEYERYARAVPAVIPLPKRVRESR